MIVLIKSAPDTADGARGVALAKDGNADIVLLQNGVYFAQRDRLGDFSGAVYALDDDMRLRGITDSERESRVKTIDYDKLTDIVVGGKKVVGMF
jgi:sulfur relay protein TusB/DsrH